MRERNSSWWWTVVTIAFLSVLIVGYALDDAWVKLALAMCFAALLVADLRQSRARRRMAVTPAAAQQWPPDRVKAVTAGAMNEVKAVRAVREVDPGLSLLDAVQLVRGTPAA